MEAHAKYTLVGSVVLALMVLIAFAALWLANKGDQGGSKFYTIYFKHFSLSGLQEDSPVSMRGIKVGNVRSLEISPSDIELVKVNIRINASVPVKTDTRGVINRNLLTGLANIELTNSSQGAPELEALPPGEEYPVIIEGQTQLEKLQSSLPELLENTNEMVREAALLLSSDNREKVTKMLSNLERITDRVVASENRIEDAMKGVRELTTDAKALVRELQASVSDVTTSLKHTSEIFAQETQNVSHDISQATQSFASTMEKFDDPRSIILGPSEAELGPGERRR